jgi:probable HAF family extracellular repeat protein
MIDGWFESASGASYGYLDVGGVFTTLDPPGSTSPFANSTQAYHANDEGDIVGFFSNATGEHGFLYENGAYTTIDYPGATYTQVFGMNNAGDIVGAFGGAGGITCGFIAEPANAPEPASLALLGVGAAALSITRRRRTKPDRN